MKKEIQSEITRHVSNIYETKQEKKTLNDGFNTLLKQWDKRLEMLSDAHKQGFTHVVWDEDDQPQFLKE